MTKKITEKDKAILGQWAYYLPILALLVGYGIFLYLVRRTDTLQPGDLINNITIFVGWIVALLTAVIYLNKTRKDNQKLKKEEIRRSLEIDAFREINKAVTNFASVLVEVSNKYLWWPYELKMHRENPKYHKFDKVKIELETDQQRISLMRVLTNFILAIEANEIAVIQFDRLRKYIQSEVDGANKLIMEFLDYFMPTEREILLTEPGCLDFRERCKKIKEELDIICCYLFDYRIELMNSRLGETFDSQVPIRKPRDPKYKVLTEVAIKEEVEKEAERRGKEFLAQGPGKEHLDSKGTDHQ